MAFIEMKDFFFFNSIKEMKLIVLSVDRMKEIVETRDHGGTVRAVN